jgi:hypothetical protein
MVSCRSTATQIACAGSGALAGLYLYTGTGSEMFVADGETAKIQIMTESYTCDDTGFVPVEYCLDWGDGYKTSGTFPIGMAVARNVEVSHQYFYSGSHGSLTCIPSATILTACGGTRTVNTTDAGRSLSIYVQKPGVPAPAPNMSNYKLNQAFSTATCAGIHTDYCNDGETSETCVNGYKQKCDSGMWIRDLSRQCEDGSGGGGALSCTGETKCMQNGMEYGWCTANGQTGWTGTGKSCTPTSVQEGSTRCVGANGQKYVNGSWVNDSTISCQGTGSGDITNPPAEGGDDILASIMDFYNNNKLISIAGIALLGGLVMFGGSK